MSNFLSKFQNFEPLTIVCIGDSTTSQEWCHPNWVDWLNFTFKQDDNWPHGWNRKLINSGKDGGTIYDFLEFFDREIGQFRPDAVIVSLGFNHIELAKSPDQLRKDLEQLCTQIKSIGADIITWSTYDVPHLQHSGSLAVIRDIYKEVTAQFGGVFVDIYAEFQRYDLSKIFTFISPGIPEWQIKAGDIDYLHCNTIGNQIIAGKIAKDVFGVELLDWPDFGTMQKIVLDEYLKK